MRRLRPRDTLLRIWSMVVACGLIAATAGAADITTIATSYQPTINETIDASGFKHPGVGLTKDVLENMRTQVRAQKEPWNTYFNQMLLSGAASTTPSIKNVSGSDPTQPRYYGLNSQGVESLFVTDALTAYTQAILYYVTGNETYRANALRIIRLYSLMDPSQFAYYTDAHIHTGIPLQRMVGAAEILRYTSYQTASLAWTDDDTNNFVNNFMLPTINTDDSSNEHFMNQHLYTTIGAMSGWIFTGNRDKYNEAVEWYTVNKTAADQGQNGAIKALFRLVTRNDDTGEQVTPAVQHVEMGRDQAHGAGDITNAQILARFLMAQGTKIDPVDGTPSTAPEAVGPYEFLGDRILQAAEQFGAYMQGYEIPWIPTASHTDAYGSPTVVYHKVAGAYRGRLTQNTWEMYYYYKYTRGVNLEQVAPNFTRIFANRTVYNWDGGDGGGDFWLFIPAAAAAEGSNYLVKKITDPYREVEVRFTPLDANSVLKTDTTASYIETTATEAGSNFAVYGYGYGTTSLAFKVRTNGTATMQFYGTSVQLPNTNGQWMYVNYAGGLGDFLAVTIKGSGTTVDIDHININGSSLSLPSFTIGNADLSVYTYAGSSQAVSANFAATDSNASATLTYQIDNLPFGASFNSSTGAFSWQPTQAGSYSFVVSAKDGTTVTSKRVTVVVGADRQAAVNAVIAAYNPNLLYVSSTLATYTAAYNDIAGVISSATDTVFFQKLATLQSAVTGLQLLTPVISDGSMNYTNMLASSTFGTQVANALDNNPDSFVGYYLAQNQTHTLDFGPGFKIAATSFGLQVRTSFPERVGGTTVYGSNDNTNWTRLTPGLTSVTEDMQNLPVEDDLQNQRFRFIKIAMIQPSSSMLELGEFHIFGTRYETVNLLSAVTLSSDQALRNRIVLGNTVKLKFVSTAPINSVSVTIQGQLATVTTTDNLNWIATWVANATAPYGKVSFQLNYKTAAGADAEPTFFTTDGSGVFVADQTDLINNVTTLATVTDSSGRDAASAIATANLLFDSNLSTITDYRVNGSGNGSWVEFDFRGGGTVNLTRAEMIVRQDSNTGRLNGAVVQGSNDNTTWETITNVASSSADWQTLTVNTTTPYRYLRVFNGNAWFGNMAELRLYGTYRSTAQIATASITSAQSLSPAATLNKRIVPGNTVTLKFSSKVAISNATATIQGVAATVGTTDNINFTATAILPQGVAAGNVGFAINYQQQDGTAGYPANATTDGSAVYVVDESDVIRNISTIATLIDSSQLSYHNAAATKANVDVLFDGNISTTSDFRIGSTNSGTGSYIIFDFKSGNQVNLTSVEMLARQDQTGRAKGVVFQGSNDNTSWTTIAGTGAQTADWQTFTVSSAVPYRYLRIINGASWFGNLAEVRLHGSLHASDTTAPVTQANVPGVTVGTVTTVTLSATDVGSGVQATYYTIDGGAKQTGTSIAVPADGAHTLAYWSVDWAGNVEQQHTATVSLDKTSPVIAGLYADVTTPTNQNVTVTIYYPTDAAVKEYKLGDNGAWSAYSAPVVVTDNTTVYARSADAAGNVSAVASLAVANINKVPPAGASFAPSITDPTQGSVTLSIAYPASVVLRQYRIDGGAWTAYAGPVTVNDNATVSAQSVDSVGNVSPVTSYAVTNIDRIAPVDAQFSADITDPTNKDVTVTVIFPADAATREYKLGADGPWTAYGAPVLMSGNGTVFARAADAAGNVSNVTQYVVANIDRIPPVGAALAVDTTSPTNQGVTVTITYPDDAAVREFKVGDGEWTPYTAAVLVADDNTVYARGSDAVGNVSNVTSIVVSNIYKVVPITNVALNPASPNGKNGWYTSDVSVTLAANPGAYGGAVTTEYQVNGGAWTASTGDAIAFGEGSYKLGYRTRDQAGNAEQVKTIEFKIDKTAPTLSVVLDKNAIWPPNHMMVPINAALTAADAGSSVESVILTNITSSKPDSGKGDIEADFGTPATTFSVRAEKDRVYTVTYTATDKAGNVTPKTASITVPHDQSGQ
ncbi:MAG: discoidin domain-containing protein [Pseudomonadota bacterium]